VGSVVTALLGVFGQRRIVLPPVIVGITIVVSIAYVDLEVDFAVRSKKAERPDV
jgi:hypothetical protein